MKKMKIADCRLKPRGKQICGKAIFSMLANGTRAFFQALEQLGVSVSTPWKTVFPRLFNTDTRQATFCLAAIGNLHFFVRFPAANRKSEICNRKFR